MSIENLILGVNSVTVSYLIHYDSLLQNATNFTNFIFYTTAILWQNATEVYYKMQQLLQNATFVTNRDSTVLIVFYKTAFLHTVSYLN